MFFSFALLNWFSVYQVDIPDSAVAATARANSTSLYLVGIGRGRRIA